MTLTTAVHVKDGKPIGFMNYTNDELTEIFRWKRIEKIENFSSSIDFTFDDGSTISISPDDYGSLESFLDVTVKIQS